MDRTPIALGALGVLGAAAVVAAAGCAEAGCAEARSESISMPPAAAPAKASASVSSVEPSIAGSAKAAAKTGGPLATDQKNRWNGVDVDSWPPIEEPGHASGARLYSRVRHLWIRPAPGSGAWLGYLSLGESVRLKGGDAEKAFVANGNGLRCAKWYAVEPEGVVCAGEDATLDRDDPVVVELAKQRADPTSPWPYQYAESLETPVYDAPPDEKRQLKSEYALAKHLDTLAKVASAKTDDERRALGKQYVGLDLTKAKKGPPKLLDLPPGGRLVVDRVAMGSTLAYTDSFDYAGRTFLRTWDQGFVPKDRVRPFAESSFHGVVLGNEVKLPLAFFREKPRPKVRRSSDGRFELSEETWPRLGHVQLTGKSEVFEDERYFETREPGMWVRRSDASIVEQTSDLPKQVAKRTEGRRSWLDISILKGTLVAYEYDQPLYATLISPGRGGLPVHGVPTLETASTPTGAYSVLGKFVTATMVSSTNSSLVHAEVQYTQNFTGPYALHGAYWHNDWGQWKSGGCVNLSPIDSRRIFRFTEPRLPDGWHGMRTIDFGYKTIVYVHR